MNTSATRSLLVWLLAAIGSSACGESIPDAPGVPGVVPGAPTDGGVPGPHEEDGSLAEPEVRDPALPVLGAHVTGLSGTGLRLRTIAGEELAVTGDGEIAFGAPVTAASEQVLEIVQQPTSPSQTCSARLRAQVVEIACEVDRFAVGGTVQGVAGPGLTLTSSWGESLAVEASGTFRFTERQPDLSSFSIAVAGSPEKPKQACVLARGEGRVSGSDVTDLSVLCTTEKFALRASVHGLLGRGLEIELVGAESVSVEKDGAFSLRDAIADGTPYAVRVKQQPAKPEQRCLVIDGESAIAGGDVELAIVCGALGGLRISEVGSCHYANSACWFELYNAGDAMEELSYYQVRATSAQRVSPYSVREANTYALPSAAIAPKQRIVVRGESTGSLPSGQGVVHVRDGEFLPWWSGSGFVELVTAGQSVDFVRFGDAATQPLTTGAWTGSGASALPNGAEGYGYSLARDLANTDSDRAGDWIVRAFATPGGPNDVTSDADTDQDGVPDSAETKGGTFAGMDLYAMGARVGPRDVFVEIDRMDSDDDAVVPRKEALEKVVQVFAARNIAVHFDVGPLFSATFDPAKFNLGGGNVVPFAKAAGLGSSQAGVADLYVYKAAHMAAARRSLFYYSLFAWSQNANGTGGSSGLGERPGNDTLITLGGWGLDASTPVRRNMLINYQAATLMHELGHNFGLRHGGSDDLNHKPNYVSVMNYLYSPFGLPTIGRSEGDRYDIYKHCRLWLLGELTNPPTGSPDAFILDFSDGYSGDVSEASVLERDGLGRMDSRSVDFNCNGEDDKPYARDLNEDGRKDLLTDFDDWTNLEFVFRRSFSGNESGPELWPGYARKATRPDVHTDETQFVPSESCPGLARFAP